MQGPKSIGRHRILASQLRPGDVLDADSGQKLIVEVLHHCRADTLLVRYSNDTTDTMRRQDVVFIVVAR